MEQRKIEHITLHLIVFGTIAIIGVLARQTVLHYSQRGAAGLQPDLLRLGRAGVYPHHVCLHCH